MASAATAIEPEVITKDSPRDVGGTVTRLLELLEKRDLTLFAVIDQAAEARRVGLQLRPTTLVVFGNPLSGTPVMEAAPLAALELPLKVLVWLDGEQAKVSYAAPDVLAARYGLSPALAAGLAGIGPLVDALVA